MRSVFVGNLNPVATAKELKDFFSKYGTVVSVDLRMKKDSDRNKGFAFVIYEKAKEVDNLMSQRYVFFVLLYICFPVLTPSVFSLSYLTLTENI